MKKYELTDETKESFGTILHRIRALRSFADVLEGDLGGWIESESNLDQNGNAWVYYEALVKQNAKVFCNARVGGCARVIDNARIFGNAQVGATALVNDNAKVYGNARVSGDAWVFGNAKIIDNAQVGGKSKVFGDAMVSDNARVYDNAWVCCQRHIYWQPNVGSRNDTVTFYRDSDRGIFVVCGCFRGTIAEFTEAVKKTHGENRYAQEYAIVIENAKRWIVLEWIA